MKAVFIVIFLCVTSLVSAAEPYYHAVKAEKGDGIFSLLRRYHLDYHPCNRQHFLELNNLSIEDHLKAGVKYKLPIMIYQYNGTSIRTTIGIQSYEQAIRIKEYNEKILRDNLRKTNYLNSNILWVPYNELNCKDYTSTDKSETQAAPAEESADESADSSVLYTKGEAPRLAGQYIYNNLYGSKHRAVELMDKSLKNKVYYVVSGHGGPDPGAMCECSNTLCEDEYAYDVTLRLARQLESRGATVHIIIQDHNDGIRDDEYLICDYDEKCMGIEKIPLNTKKRLNQRATAINELYQEYKRKGITDQTAIVIHVDSNSEHHSQDVYFYHHKTSKSSKKLAQSLQNTFKEKYNHFQKGRGYKGFVRPRGLYMLNNTLPTCAYVELANIRNESDHQRLIINTNREALAKWLCEGMINYDK